MSNSSEWATIPACDIMAATADDNMRPTLTMPFLERDGDSWWLCATNSFVFSRVPVKGDTSTLVEGHLPPDFAKLIGEGRTETRVEFDPVDCGEENVEVILPPRGFRFEDGWWTIEQSPLGHKPVDQGISKPPSSVEVFGPYLNGDKKPAALTQIAFNPELFSRGCAAIGAGQFNVNWLGVDLTFFGETRALLIETLVHDHGGQALLMPIRRER